MPMQSKIRLTDKAIRALKPSDRPYEVADAQLSGFGIRVLRSGRKGFFYRYQIGSKRRRVSLRPYRDSGDLAEARREAETLRGLVIQGIDPRTMQAPRVEADGGALVDRATPDEPKHITFSDVATRWIEEHAKPNKVESSWREDQRILGKDVLPAWQDRPVDEIRPRDVRKLLRKIQQRGGVIANRTHAVVRAIFGWALEEELVESNPAAIRRVHREKPPKTIVQDADLVTLWKVWADEQSMAGAAMCLYLLTGLRLRELSTVSWSQVRDGRLELPTTKNGMSHTAYLSRQAQSIVEALRQVSGDGTYVFPSPRHGGVCPVESWATSVERFREVSGVHGWSVQTLRRTASTILAREGVEPFITDIFLNHVQGDVTHRHYVRYRYADRVAAANQTLGDFVEGLVGSTTIEVRPYRRPLRSVT